MPNLFGAGLLITGLLITGLLTDHLVGLRFLPTPDRFFFRGLNERGDRIHLRLISAWHKDLRRAEYEGKNIQGVEWVGLES